MKYYTIIIIIASILLLLYFGYKLSDIPKTLLDKSCLDKSCLDNNEKKNQKVIVNESNLISKSNIFLNIQINKKDIGKVIIELFDEDVPKTCNNFRYLCTKGIKNKKTPAYKNTKFNCIIKDFMLQGGDIINNNGSSGYSIYGKYFSDENFNLKHNQEGLLSMANCGKDKNNSQFFILTKKGGCQQLDNKYVVFGIIVSGYDIIKKIENIKTDTSNNPIEECIISDCGLVEEKEDYSIKEVPIIDDKQSSKYKISI